MRPQLTQSVKYVALLAFNKIVVSHPQLVSVHQDVILNCIDDPDISIRLQALELGSGMINADNLTSVVDRLMQQLRDAPFQRSSATAAKAFSDTGVEPAADSDGEDPEETLRTERQSADEIPPMADEYRITIIQKILSMCSRDTYTNISDFEWYIQTLVELVHLVPSTTKPNGSSSGFSEGTESDVSNVIGAELRNVAVRVGSVRAVAVKAASSLLQSFWKNSNSLVREAPWQLTLLGLWVNMPDGFRIVRMP